MAKCRGHATMGDALDAHPALADVRVSEMDMDMNGGGSMMAKMHGHATMGRRAQRPSRAGGHGLFGDLNLEKGGPGTSTPVDSIDPLT